MPDLPFRSQARCAAASSANAGAATIAIPSLAAILAACGKPGSSPSRPRRTVPDEAGATHHHVCPSTRTRSPPTRRSSATPRCGSTTGRTTCGRGCSGSSRIDYSDYGVTVEVTTFNDISEGIQKMSSPDRSRRTSSSPIRRGIWRLVLRPGFRPLTTSCSPISTQVLAASSRTPSTIGGWRYTVPYTIYTTGIAYRRDHISDDEIGRGPTRTSVLWDPEYRGKGSRSTTRPGRRSGCRSSRMASPTSTRRISVRPDRKR